MTTHTPNPLTPPGLLRQPARRAAQTLDMTLPCLPANIDWRTLDNALQPLLGMSLTEVSESDHLSEEEKAIHRFIRRIAAASSTLLQGCGIPAFDYATIQSLCNTDEEWRLQLSVVQIDNIPARAMMLAYQAGRELVLALLDDSDNATTLPRFYSQLESKVLPLLLENTIAPPPTMALLHAAWLGDIPWQYEGNGVYQLGWGCHALHHYTSRLATDSPLGIDVAGNKLMAAQWLRRAGLPAPNHHVAGTVEQAIQAAEALGSPVVIKPLNRDRGEGVSINLASHTQISHGFTHAARYSPQVLVEKQVNGDCHRILVVRGKVMYIVKRLPVAVQGDGQHSVAELISRHNQDWLKQPPWQRPPPLLADAATQQHLQQHGHTLASIIANGQWQPLREIESTADGGRDEDRLLAAHPDNLALAIQAAALLGLDVAGVDIITPDISIPWHENGAIINEVNAAPALGASESSRAAMPAMMTQLLKQGGRIPVEVFIGDISAQAHGLARREALAANSIACYFSSPMLTLDGEGQEIHLACDSISDRCRALLADRDVGALIMVMSEQVWRQTSWPLDRVDRVTMIEDMG